MSTKSRRTIYGGRIIGAEIRAQGAPEAAQKAIREADRAEAEGYGGPAQPSPTIAQCLNGGYSPLHHAKKTRRASKGSSSGERHEITNAPPDRSCHDSAMLGVGNHEWHGARSAGAMDAHSRRLSSCWGFRPLECTPDIATARRSCPSRCLGPRARPRAGSRQIFPLNIAVETVAHQPFCEVSSINRT